MTARLAKTITTFVVLVWMAGCTSVMPRHEVLPYPDHIHAAVAVGDRVQVTTRDGHTRAVTVTELTSDAIKSGADTIRFEDIVSLTKQSWSPPRNPCDDGRPLGCSIPPLVTLLSEMHADYARELAMPCAQHDFCYRYGNATYGLSREECDAAFRENMLQRCAAKHSIDLLARTECSIIAKQMHTAVREFGAPYFETSGAAYCEYAGPPAHQPLKK